MYCYMGTAGEQWKKDLFLASQGKVLPIQYTVWQVKIATSKAIDWMYAGGEKMGKRNFLFVMNSTKYFE